MGQVHMVQTDWLEKRMNEYKSKMMISKLRIAAGKQI
jgi:hypothetical protein